MARTAAADSSRAKRSGFGRKLALYFAAAKEEVRTTGFTDKVRNGPALAAYLEKQGEPVEVRTVNKWLNRRALPNARYIAALERLFGAPWSYLDGQGPWPRRIDRNAVIQLVSLLSEADLERFAAEVRERALAARR